jgi:hypothetical protein
MVACRECPTSAHLALKSAIYGEGFGRKCWPEDQKSAISEKEIAIFELRKVLFPEKHLRELPGAYECPNRLLTLTIAFSTLLGPMQQTPT